MKSKMKKSLALVCVLALGVGCIAISTPTEEVKATEETEVTPVYLEGFRHVTLSSFNTKSEVGNISGGINDITAAYATQLSDTVTFDGIDDSTGQPNREYNSTYLTPMHGYEGASFDKTLLSVKVKYDNFVQNQTRLLMAGTDAGTTNGIAFVLNNNTHFVLQAREAWTGYKYNNVEQIAYIKAADVGLKATTDSFLLQLSFEYGELQDNNTIRPVKIGVYINGQMYDYDQDGVHGEEDDKVNLLIPDKYLGRMFRIRTGASAAVTVQSCVPEPQETTDNPGWEKLIWSDFKDGNQVVAPNRAFFGKQAPNYSILKNSDKYSAEYNQKLGNTSFEANIRLKSIDTNIPRLYYGAKDAWTGICFTLDDTKLKITSTPGSQKFVFTDPVAQGGCYDIVFNPTIAGVGDTFNDKEFTLKITNQPIDYDRDGTVDATELGVFFNGKLYNNQYLYIKNYQSYTNASDMVIPAANNGNILIRNTPEIDEVSHQLSALSGGVYTTLTTDFTGAASVFNGDVNVNFEAGLNISGDYKVRDAEGVDIGQVILYETNDTHPDGEVDVADLVAMLKVQKGTALSTWSGTMGAYAADFSETGIINSILGIETVSE